MKLWQRLWDGWDPTFPHDRIGHKQTHSGGERPMSDMGNGRRLRVDAMTARETPGALRAWYQEAPNGVTVTVLDMDLLPVAGRLPRPRNIMLLKQGTRTE